MCEKRGGGGGGGQVQEGWALAHFQIAGSRYSRLYRDTGRLG